jgi:SRSO17 transposase
MSGRLMAATLREWATELDAVGERIARHFSRVEPGQRALGYLRLLLSDVERKNGWQMAERLGDANPFAVQHLLGRAVWDADAVRHELVRYVGDHLGDPEGVFVVDETGFLKKGTQSVGVARQYSGTAGRIENCQIGVFLGYATRHGSALLDRELYLPKEWADDAARRKAAHVPAEVEFTTKIVLAKRMIERAMAAGVPAKWVTADAVYGSDYNFRIALEKQGLGYVVAVRSDFAVWIGGRQMRAKAVLAEIPADAWRQLSCGDGSKGPRLYDWALLRTNSPEPQVVARWLLIRRSIADPNEIAYFACGGPPATTLEELVAVAGRRWTIEENFELGKGDCGLDEYEVRNWDGWYRHVTLSLWALAVVTVIRSRALRTPQPKKRRKVDPAERARGAQGAVPDRLEQHHRRRARDQLVGLATPPSVLG